MEKIRGKRVEVVVAGSGEAKLLGLSSEASVGDVIKEASLDGYVLSRADGALLPARENIYDLVENGERIYAAPGNLEVGFSTPFWRDLDEQIKKIIDPNYFVLKNNFNQILYPKFPDIILQEEKVTFLGIKKLKPSVREEGKRHLLPYWQRRGWTEFRESLFIARQGYRGYYKTKLGSWRGLIMREFENNYTYYIINPPIALKKGKHSDCFDDVGNGKYSIHFHEEPETINEGIITIEKAIVEALES